MGRFGSVKLEEDVVLGKRLVVTRYFLCWRGLNVLWDHRHGSRDDRLWSLSVCGELPVKKRACFFVRGGEVLLDDKCVETG